MPEQTIKSEIQDGLRTVGELARKFDVSRAAMEFRLKNLGLADQLTDLADKSINSVLGPYSAILTGHPPAPECAQWAGNWNA